MAEKKGAAVKDSKGPNRVTISFDELLQKFEEERTKLAGYDQRRVNVQTVITEAKSALDTLDAIEKAGKGEKILVPIGSGVYIEASLEDNKRLKTALIGDVVSETSPEETRKMLNTRLDEFTKSFRKLAENEQRALRNLQNMENLIRRMGANRNAPAGAQAPSGPGA